MGYVMDSDTLIWLHHFGCTPSNLKGTTQLGKGWFNPQLRELYGGWGFGFPFLGLLRPKIVNKDELHLLDRSVLLLTHIDDFPYKEYSKAKTWSGRI